MAIYLKKFETQDDYEAAQSGLILPNVSYTVDNNTVHYNPFVDPYNGHEYVDLGLPSGTKWATMNVGATKPEEYGLYFSWGNVEGHNLNGEGTYDFGTSNTSEPYVSSNGATITFPGSIAVGDAYDMARANMGGNWRLPTNTEFQELYDNTDSEWITINGVNGRRLTSKINGNSIFFPAAGVSYDGSSHYYEGSAGYYWSSVLFSADYAFSLRFHSGGVLPQSYAPRYFGSSVRAVIG